MANYIVTKSITGISNATLQSFASLSTLLAQSNNNWIKRIIFVCEPNSNLTAQSTTQNNSCFNIEGDVIKLVQNPVGATVNINFELSPNDLTGELLDLRTALKFTATGNVYVILFF
jgi:hypothetical protein